VGLAAERGSTLEKSMKKTLLALAAIAASSAAMAQSTVTLYGVVDASVENVKGDKSITRVTSDNLSSSRFGLKGSEDIGGGLKGNFVLESGLKVDTGENGGKAIRFFDRAAWLGLAGGFGDVRFGRIDTPIGDIAGNVLSAQAYDDLKILPTRAGNGFRRTDNAVTYILPKLVSGLTATLQYTTANGTSNAAGAETAGSSFGKGFGLSVKFVEGPLSAGLGYQRVNDDGAAAGDQRANATLVYAGYDLGVAKVTAFYDAETDPTNAKGRRMSVAGAKVSVPVSPEFTAIVGAATARNTKGLAAGTDNAQIVTVKGVYTLSKRTAVYGMFTNVNNDTANSYNLGAAPVTGEGTRGLAVGVRHAF
jgi:general bacterial porin, GBP family